MENLTSMIQELISNNNSNFETLYTELDGLTVRVIIRNIINNGTLNPAINDKTNCR